MSHLVGRTDKTDKIPKQLSVSEILGGLKEAVTRFEVHDETGRAYVRKGVDVEVSYQDGGRTLKVFVEALKVPGDKPRRGAVKPRSQVKNPITGTWTKRDNSSGKFMDVKADKSLFKGVRGKKPFTIGRKAFAKISDIEKVKPTKRGK